MRAAVASVLFLMPVGWFVLAQPPGGPLDPPRIVIKPKRPGESPEAETPDKTGFLVIRPNGKGATTTQVAEPKTTSPVPAGTPGTTMAGVPPPGPQPESVAGKDGKPLFDYWFVVGIEGQRAGYVNWAAKEVEKNEKRYAIGVRYLNLSLSRFGQVISQWGEESTVETEAGDILITSMRQGLGKDQALALTGTVEGKILKIRGEGAAAQASDTPWPGGVVGLVREPRLFKELSLKPQESFEFPSYIPTVNRVVKTTITLEAEETRVLWPNTPPRKLLRFVTRPAPIGKVKLPASVTWVDAESFEPLMLETDFPALGGRLTFLRTTKESATAPVARPVEVFNTQSIRLNREIPGIHGKGSVVYKVSVPRDDEPDTVFAQDARQRVENLDSKTRTFELHVSASHGPKHQPIGNTRPEPAPDKEFTESNYFINWNNDLVKAHAARAIVGLPPTASAWDKALAVERWVKANMKAFEFSQAMATADNVARTLSGDCTEYAMLAAAMCRVHGIPSRTSLGVVYAPGREGKPFLAYHMWFEVYADGQWLPLDATLGLGGVGPGHIKITDHSWHEEKSFAPLLPVLRALTAKPAVDVLRVEP
jgi:transglutaminase-like putative cysteine protease